MHRNRWVLAFVAYAALGVLAWSTLEAPKLRLATLAVLGLFALKTLVRRKDVLHTGENEQSK